MENTEYFGLYLQSTPPAPTLTGAELVPAIQSDGATNNTTTGAIAALAGSTALPRKVAQGSYVLQSADLPETTIYTPTVTALYQISFYFATAVADGSAGTLNLWLSWTDPIQTIPFTATGLQIALSALANFDGGAQIVELVAGQPYQLGFLITGIYATAKWSAWWQIEQLTS
jgi:hypothetical protein